jgi:hypothetical protein
MNVLKGNNKLPKKEGKKQRDALSRLKTEPLRYLGCFLHRPILHPNYGIVLECEKKSSKESDKDYYILLVDTGSDYLEKWSAEPKEAGQLIRLGY